MSSDSDSGDDRKLPAAYAKRRRRRDSSSDSNDSDDGRRREKRQSRPSKKEDDRRRNARKKEKKDRPMWKEEGEISGESDNESASSSSSSSRSRSRDRRRRRQRRHSIDRRQPRKREVVKVSHKCNDCGCSHFSLKAHIHHQLHDHNLGAQCHLCQKKFETQKAIQEHYELDHTQEIVKCNFCKSPFDQPLEMKGVKWDEFFSHLYGEIFYSRLAEYEERGHG
ncbi:unnamed protein product [Caenorhabditis brenneri]